MNYRFHREAKIATAVIIKKETVIKRSTSNEFLVSYRIPGETNELNRRLVYLPDSKWDKYEVGDKIDIVYHPNYPGYIYLPGGIPQPYSILVLLLIFGFFVLIILISAFQIILKRVFS